MTTTMDHMNLDELSLENITLVKKQEFEKYEENKVMEATKIGKNYDDGRSKLFK